MSSVVRVLSELICIPYNIRRASSRNVSFFQGCPLELAQQLTATNACIGEGYRLRSLDRLCPRCVLWENIFPKRYPSIVPFVLKTKARIISTVLQYHILHKTACKLTKPVLDSSYPCRVVRHTALFLSRGAPSHSQRVLNFEW